MNSNGVSLLEVLKLILMPFLFLLIFFVVSHYAIFLPEWLLSFFAKNESESTGILKATYWGTIGFVFAVLLGFSLVIICLLFYIRKIYRKVNAMGISTTRIVKLGFVILCIPCLFMWDTFGEAHPFKTISDYSNDINILKENKVPSCAGNVVVENESYMEVPHYNGIPIVFQNIRVSNENSKETELLCPINLFKNIQLKEDSIYKINYLPKTRIITAITALKNP